jgi:LmbE family N-acetylglucosaminyl deacetylase
MHGTHPARFVEPRTRILAIFAHPDDETFLAGGTLAKYAATGWGVFVLCATRGEAGWRGDYEKENLSPGEFARVRQREMEAACEVLGVREPLFLECADQGIAKDCRDSAKAEVGRFLRGLKPDVVITFGPDGVSGHTDHVAISRIVTAAVLDVGIRPFLSGVEKETEPFRITSLYFVSRSEFLSTCCKPAVPVPSPPVTTVIDVSGYTERKLEAMRCYRSQMHLLSEDPTVIMDTRDGQELFHRAFPARQGGEIEDRLFVRPYRDEKRS